MLANKFNKRKKKTNIRIQMRWHFTETNLNSFKMFLLSQQGKTIKKLSFSHKCKEFYHKITLLTRLIKRTKNYREYNKKIKYRFKSKKDLMIS